MRARSVAATAVARVVPATAVAALAAAAAFPGAAPLAAQRTAPPPPLPMEEVEFPPFQERTLSNGARLLVVSQGEVPFVTVTLVLGGGGVVEPEGQEGLADMVAGLLDKGTTTRTDEEIADAVDFLGASLAASASADWSSVSLSLLTPDLEDGLELMADVVVNPSFPGEQIDLLRTRTISSLQVGLSQPGTIASRRFAEEVYGDHPYGRLQTPSSIRSVDRRSLVAYHDTWYRPENALFVVSGDVDAEAAEAALEAAFEGWLPGDPPPVSYGEAPTRDRPGVVLVHRPGSVQATVRAGHLLMEGDHPDWTALVLANHVLGSPTGRLNRVLREERGLTYAAGATTNRRRDRGVFVASVDVRNEVLGDALAGLLEEIRRLREEMVPPGELADSRDFLVGSFPLQIETPQQIAGQVAQNRLLGLPDDAIETYRERVSALGPAEVQEAARAHLDPSSLVVVVVGDALALRSQLRPFGPLTVVDPEGNVLTAQDLEPAATGEAFDASRLEPGTYVYRILFQGQEVGSMTRRLVPDTVDGRPAMTMIGEAVMGPQRVEQEVTFGVPGFEPLAASATIRAGGQGMSMDVRVRDGRVLGELRTPMGTRDMDRELPEGALLGDMVELAVWLADLEERREIRIPVVQLQSGAVETQALTPGPVEEVTVPAGTFRARRVEIGGSQPQVVWAREESPHVLLRLEPAGQPVVLELVQMPGAMAEPGGD